MVVQVATGPQQPQQVPRTPRKQDVDGDNVAVVVEDVRLAVPYTVQQAIIYWTRTHS